MPAWSAVKPAITGRTAPPTIAMQSRPDVAATGAVERSSVSVKMVGNMIELKSPTARIVHIAVWPPNSIEEVISTAATVAHKASRDPGRNRRRSPAPRNLPTIAPPQ